MEKPYKHSIGSGRKWYAQGPGDGFGYYSGTLWPNMRFAYEADAIAAAICSNEAYRQGYLKAQQEVRLALGLKE